MSIKEWGSQIILLWVDNDFSFEPHLALFMKLQEAYSEYERQFSYA
jgi:hypothetical protein